MNIAPLEAIVILVFIGLVMAAIAGLLGWQPLHRSSDERTSSSPDPTGDGHPS